MPYYDYECEDCGVFTEMRPMEASAAACACPQCEAPSARTFLVMPALFGMDAGKRRATAVNEESRERPKTVAEYSEARARRHPAGCGCCESGKRRAAAVEGGARMFPTARPWMISH